MVCVVNHGGNWEVLFPCGLVDPAQGVSLKPAELPASWNSEEGCGFRQGPCQQMPSFPLPANRGIGQSNRRPLPVRPATRSTQHCLAPKWQGQFSYYKQAIMRLRSALSLLFACPCRSILRQVASLACYSETPALGMGTRATGSNGTHALHVSFCSGCLCQVAEVLQEKDDPTPFRKRSVKLWTNLVGSSPFMLLRCFC